MMQKTGYLAKQGLAIGVAVLLSQQAFALRPDDQAGKDAIVFHAVPLAAQQKAPGEVVAQRKAAAAKRTDLSVRWDESSGTPSLVMGLDILREGRAANAPGAVAADPFGGKAIAVMAVLSPIYGIGDAKVEFEVGRANRSASGYRHIRLKQKHQGLPVFGGEVIVHFDAEGKARTVNGVYRNIDKINVKPTLTPAQAAAAAQADLAALRKPAGVLGDRPELVVYAPPETDPVLAYQIVLSYNDGKGVVGRWRYWIDARSGAVVTRYNDVPTAAPVAPTTPFTITGALLTGEGGGVTNVVGVRDLLYKYFLYNVGMSWSIFNANIYDYAQRSTPDWGISDRVEMSAGRNIDATQAYFRNVHGRDSYDAEAAMALVTVHYGFDYVNAFWNGAGITIGDGDDYYAGPLGVLDVMAHEFTHAVTEYTANLTYQDEPGALNESFSDIFGALVEFAAQPDGRAAYPDRIAGAADWLMGEDCWLSSTALRDMRDPSNTNTVGYGNEQPSRYNGSYWYNGPADYGGVHQNSGVQNFFFYLLCEGGSGTNDVGSNAIPYQVDGVGIPAGGKIAYLTLSSYLGPLSRYADAADAWFAAAQETDASGATTNTSLSVWYAWAAVGFRKPLDMVLPKEPFASVGDVGTESYSPAGKTYTVENPFSTSMTWYVSYGGSNWLSVAPTNFILGPRAKVNVNLTINQAAAASLPEGTYVEAVVFSNNLNIGNATNKAYLRCGRNYTVRETPYAWVDRVANAHDPLVLNPMVSSTISVPFTFQLYYDIVTNLYASMFGIVSSAPDGLFAPNNTALSSSTISNAALYPLWDNVAVAGIIYLGVDGVEPNRRLILTWENVKVGPTGLSPAFSYQVIIREGPPGLNNDIVFQYREVAEYDEITGSGRSASIGVGSLRTNMFWEYSDSGSALVLNEKALLFTQLPVSDTNAPTGTIDPYRATESTVTFDVRFSEPVYGLAAGDIALSSSVPGASLGAVTGGGMRYFVNVNNVTNYGRVSVGVVSNAVQDLAGLSNAAVGPTLYVVPVRDTAFFDDMEKTPPQWTASTQVFDVVTSKGWEWGKPNYVYGPPAAHSGSNCWGTVLNGDYTNYMDAWVESIPIHVGANPILDFYLWCDLYDFGYVEVNNGGGWYNVTPGYGYYYGMSGGWIRQTIALDGAIFGNRDIKVRYRITSDAWYTRAGMYVDDVRVVSSRTQGLWVVNYTPTNSVPGVTVPMKLTFYNSSTTNYPNVIGNLSSPDAGVSFSGATAIAYGAMGPGDLRTNPAPITMTLAAAGNFSDPALPLYHHATAVPALFGQTLPFTLIGVTPVIGTNVLIVKSTSGVTNWVGQALSGNGTAGSCLYQVIYAGTNGVADPPTASGQVTGDDKVLYTLGTHLPYGLFGDGGVPANMGMFTKSFAHSLPSNAPVYIRAWDASTFDAAVAYGNSALYRLKALATQTNNFGTWGVGMLSNPSRDSNGDGVPDGVAILAKLDPRQPDVGLASNWIAKQKLGVGGSGNGQFDTMPASPTRVGCSDKFFFALDTGNNRIQVWNRASGSYVGSFGTLGSGSNQFSMPYGLGMDPRSGSNRFAVADQNNFRINVYQYNPVTGTNITFLFSFGGSNIFTKVSDVAIAPNGRFYATDENSLYGWGAQVVRVFSPSGSFLYTLATYGSDSGMVAVPSGVTVGPDGTVVVADTGNNRLQAWNASGSLLWSTDGTGIQLNAPRDAAFGPGGLLYVADTGNSRLLVLRITNSTPSLVATFPTISVEPAVYFKQPSSLFVPAGTNIAYVADTANYRVLAVNLVFDADGDGIDDAWEILHGLDPTNPNDALMVDPATGYTFLGDYRLNMDPVFSFLRIAGFSLSPQLLSWQSVSSGGVYQIEYTGNLLSNVWQSGPTVTSQVQGTLSATNLFSTTNLIEFIRVRFVTNSL